MTDKTKRTPWIASLGFCIASIAGVTSVFSGIGYRSELLDLLQAFELLRWTAIGGGIGATLCLIGIFRSFSYEKSSGLLISLVGLVIGLLVLWFPFNLYQTAQSVPPIHDISTDTADPPRFDRIVALRTDAPNSHIYGGPDIARQQQIAYPDVKTVTVEQAQDAVFSVALEAAKDLGWEIISVSAEDGIIEATDTTLWFGFKDDVVIRIRPIDSSTRVDVRSVSRIGQSDLGKNAERIRGFLSSMNTRLAEP